MKLIIVEAAQIGDVVGSMTERQTVYPREEVEAVLEAVGQQLDMTEVRDIMANFRHACSLHWLL